MSGRRTSARASKGAYTESRNDEDFLFYDSETESSDDGEVSLDTAACNIVWGTRKNMPCSQMLSKRLEMRTRSSRHT